jgi:hypothetical protein
MKTIENLAVALLLGICGFFSGVLVWWVLAFTPGLDIPFTNYFHLSVVLAIVFFVYGLFRSNKAVDLLGEIWKGLVRVWGLLWWFRFLR